ncbi:unnamed protein product, partial [Amoebophrya sp. A25]
NVPGTGRSYRDALLGGEHTRHRLEPTSPRGVLPLPQDHAVSTDRKRGRGEQDFHSSVDSVEGAYNMYEDEDIDGDDFGQGHEEHANYSREHERGQQKRGEHNHLAPLPLQHQAGGGTAFSGSFYTNDA